MTIWNGVSIVSPPDGELITLQKLKSRLRVDSADDDALLPDLLKGAIARIDGPAGIGYAMLQQTWRKSMDCFPCRILLPGAPIKGVTSISYVDGSGATQTVAAADYRVDLDSEPVRIEPAFDRSWPATRDIVGAVKVDYELGETDAANVAPDLIDAVCMIVAHRYENREAVIVGDSAQTLPLGVQWILNEHSRAHVSA